MKIELLDKNRIDEVIALVTINATKFVLDDFDEMGKINFLSFNSYELYLDRNIITYTALIDNKIVGMISLAKPNHIALLFVDEKYHHLKIASKLLKMVEKLVLDQLEVNSSNYGKGFYLKQGFKEVGLKQKKDGIVYTPMIKQIPCDNSFNKYDDFVCFMEQQKDRVYSLDNFQRFMNDLGNPQLLLNVIHIGGTNGKGSTTNYIKDVLIEANYSVATFTSPSLTTRNEVIKVNDQAISDQEIVKYANRYKDIWLQYSLSIFEVEVFIAIMYFIDQNVDFSIFEVGLGGRLDATNIVNPLVSVNTNIGLDHIDYLGKTYESIALNKAGIVKEGIDYITGEDKKECLDVFEEVCQKHNSELICIKKPTNYHIDKGISYEYMGYSINLDTLACYQVNNSALAINVLEYLKNKDLIVYTKEQLESGLHKSKWAGRFEQISIKPFVIVDGAHNKEGIEAFYHSAKRFDKPKIIFSALKDKDTYHMLEKLMLLSDDITVTQFNHPRAALAKDLANGFNVKIDEDYKHALDQIADYKGVVFITGSLYFISKVIKYYNK